MSFTLKGDSNSGDCRIGAGVCDNVMACKGKGPCLHGRL